MKKIIVYFIIFLVFSLFVFALTTNLTDFELIKTFELEPQLGEKVPPTVDFYYNEKEELHRFEIEGSVNFRDLVAEAAKYDKERKEEPKPSPTEIG